MTITIALAQYSTTHRNFLPYSVGLLQAMVQQSAKNPERYQFLIPRVIPLKLEQEVAALIEADLVGFSVYTWNEQRSLAVARELKAQKPEICILFGGPHVPDRAESYLRQHAFIDVCSHSSGEELFLQFVEAYPERPWQEIQGLSWLEQGGFFHTPPAPRKRDLSYIPSPFLTGVFDPLMAAFPDKNWSSTWETNRGCPFTCVYCDWGSATASKVSRFETERLIAEIDWMAAHKIEHIFCADANFGILPRDLELAQYAAKVKIATRFPGSLVVQNAKNISDRTFEIQCILADAGLDTQVTIAIQSLNPATLKASGRENISLDTFGELQRRLLNKGIHSYSDIIIGLPEESYDSFSNGLASLIEGGQNHAVQIFSAEVLPNAPMAEPAFCQRYGIETIKIPHHAYGSMVRPDTDEIIEYQNVVIATSAMPREDWVRTRALTWMLELIFYKPGTIRIPLLLLNRVGKIPFRHLMDVFMLPHENYPTVNWVWRFLTDKARRIQAGETECCQKLLPNGDLVWLYAYEVLLDMLIRTQKLIPYYREVAQILRSLCKESDLPDDALEDALFLSSSFLRLYFKQDLYPTIYQARWNVWEYYQALLQREPCELRKEELVYIKDWVGAPWRVRCVDAHNAVSRMALDPASALAMPQTQHLPA